MHTCHIEYMECVIVLEKAEHSGESNNKSLLLSLWPVTHTHTQCAPYALFTECVYACLSLLANTHVFTHFPKCLLSQVCYKLPHKLTGRVQDVRAFMSTVLYCGYKFFVQVCSDGTLFTLC